MIKRLPDLPSRTFFLFLSLFFCSVPLAAQEATNKGKEFWVAYAGQADNTNSRMALYLTADTDAAATITIGGVAVAGSPFALKARQTTMVAIAPQAAHVFLSGQAENKGIHVTATEPLVLYAHIHAGARARASATLVLPAAALGQDYYTFNYTQPTTGLPAAENVSSELTVVAVEDNTVVQITPAAPTRQNQPAHAPFQVTLQAGQVYQVQALTDLTGSRVTTRVAENATCKNIAVFSGSTYVRFGCAAALGAENLYQQAYPVAAWGKSYVALPFATRPDDRLRILVSEDNTTVWVAGSPTLLPYKGTYFEVTSSAPAAITADKPIAVAQYATAQNCDLRNTNQNAPAYPADMDMLLLNPTEQGLRETLFPAANAEKVALSSMVRHYLQVVLKTDAAPSFTINGKKPQAAFSSVANSVFSYLQEDITAAAGVSPVFRLQADGEFNAATYWYGPQESYAYPAGTSLKSLNPYADPLNQALAGPDQLALCSVTSTSLQASVPASGTGTWTVLQGTGGTVSPAGAPAAVFSGQPGQRYVLRWTVRNAPCPETSDEVEVSFLASPQADAGENTEIVRQESITLQGSGNGTYAWTPALGLSDPGVARPVATPLETTTYELRVTSPEGCVAKASVTVKVRDKEMEPAQLQVPNAFSPNDDQINDAWVIGGIDSHARASVEVFDRWGNRVFTGGPGKAWDGHFNGKPLPMGTYYYIIRQNNGGKPLSGPISLIK